MDIIRRKEQEVEEKLQQIEKQLANALNRQSELERAKREINERLDATLSQNQKLRNELEDAKSEADKVKIKFLLLIKSKFCRPYRKTSDGNLMHLVLILKQNHLKQQFQGLNLN